MSEVTETAMTIDELARRTGMSVRNIRAHQSRGLLAPPEVRGRTGYYGEGHIARIELIRDLQAEGLNLEAIRRLLEGLGSSSVEVVDFTRALSTPFEDRKPEATLQRAASELADLGIGSEAALEVAETMRRSARGVARAFVALFVEGIWGPFDRAGRPEEDWPKVREAFDRLRPLASQSLLAAFQIAMSEAIEEAVGRALERDAGGQARAAGRPREII